MAKSMAEVLAEHQIRWVLKDHPTEDRADFIPTCGTCGQLALQRPDSHREQALTAAGFGLVSDAKAEALEEAATELARLPYVRPDAPERAEYERVLAVRRGNSDAWLKARAAELRRP